MAGARAGSAPPGPRGEGAPGSRRSRSAGGAGTPAPRPPRLRPLFLWVRQRDTAVLQVHCEDYDPRNRLRLTRTPLGWRALPRTETFDAIRLPAARPTPAARPRPVARGPPAIRRARAPRRSRARRRRRAAPGRPPPFNPPPPLSGGGSPESGSRVSFESSKRDSPAWNLPDLEISIPSHTIHVPQRSEHRERSLSPEPSLSDRDFNPTPLDKLLAVAELEFNQQRTVSPDLEEPSADTEEPSASDPLHRQFAKFPFLSEDECDRDIVAFDIPDAVENGAHEDEFFAQKPSRSERKMIEDDNVFQGGMVAAKDLFESITESHYMPVDLDNHDHETINANELLDSLVEKGCEDHNIIGNDFDKIAHIVNENQDRIEGDYDEDDEEMLMDDAPVSDIIHRLEQSLDSPGQNSMTAAQGLLHLQQMTEELAEAHLRGAVDESVGYSEETYDKPQEPHIESSPNNVEVNEPIEEKEKDACAKIGEEDDEESGDVSQSNNLPMQDENHSELDNENNDNVESEDYSSGEQASESDFMHTASITKVQEEDQLSNKEMSSLDKECENHDSGDDMMPTDLRINTSTKGDSNIVDDATDELSNKSDEMPKDLSCRKRPVSPCPSPQRFDSPRPVSRGSDTVQSPQPSGIPAVPPSPELFPTPQSRSNSKSLFLETLLASPSPKMCFSSELTITKHQNEPLNLGKSRKSASPTVSSCSEEVKKSKTFGEPEEKRYRKDIPDEAPLQKLNKLFSKSSDCVLESKQKKVDSKAHRNSAEPTPLEQLQLLRCSSEFDVPDPLLVPKERFSAILASPAREIPALLLQRPELRLPEAFAFPAVLQDPDILVVSLTQLEGILQKHRSVAEKESHKQKEQKQPKPTTPNGLSDAAKVHSTAAPPMAESPLRSSAGMGAGVGAEAMAGDIDAATSAALNQMLWLPYLSQFEAAMACSQNADFLKALNSPVPPGYSAAQAPYPDLTQMFSQQSRFMNTSGYPGIPPLDYGNQLELAMWQEAMAQANGPNFQRTLKTNADTNFLKNSEAQNIFAQAAKIQHHHQQQQQQQSRGHSARTSPIARGWRTGGGAAPALGTAGAPGLPPFPWAGYPARPPQHPAQYSPGGRGRHHQPPPSPSGYYQNNNYLGGAKQPSGGRGQPAPHAPPAAEQRPRITVKSLQNLLEPPEVGSSTHPPEELPHDPHTPLWHPLFGNQKNYSSPWNWTTVTVNGD